jgi:hypothetical protein
VLSDRLRAGLLPTVAGAADPDADDHGKTLDAACAGGGVSCARA